MGMAPGFVSAATGDYSLMSTSASAGKGTPLAEATFDFTGRCFKVPPSIGAYEQS